MMRTLSLTAGLFVVTGLLLNPCLPRASAQNLGSVKGQVTFGGDKVPMPAPVNVDKDPAHCLSKGPITSEEWVVNPNNKGVRWAIVWLSPNNDVKNPEPIKGIPEALQKSKNPTVAMDQPCCRYEPHVVAMRTDQSLIFKNGGAVAHNVQYQGCGTQGNPILNPGAEQKIGDLTYGWTGMTVGCNIHGWMKAYVRVFDHPYFAVTDADGNFEIKDVPPGNYYLITWQEAIGLHNSKAVKVDGKNVISAGDKIAIAAGQETKAPPIVLQPK